MKIVIEVVLDEEYVDKDHSTGITEGGYNELMDALLPFGEVADVRKT